MIINWELSSSTNGRNMINLRSLLPICFSSLLFVANATEQEPNVIYAALDPATEVRLGKLQRADELKQYHLSTNQAYIDAVNRIGQRIANTLSYERPDFIDCWQFTVIDTHSVNCFCLGGGQVMVFEGFLERVAEANGGVLDDDMVASVLGHEMAHNVRRHFFTGATVRGSMEWILEHLADIEKDSDGRLTPEELDKLRELAELGLPASRSSKPTCWGLFTPPELASTALRVPGVGCGWRRRISPSNTR